MASAVSPCRKGVLANRSSSCADARVRYGLDLPRCPSGNVRQTVGIEVSNLRRGVKGTVSLAALAHYTTRDSDSFVTAPVPEFTSITVSLVDAKHVATPLATTWSTEHDRASGLAFVMPEVPDGDYQVHASYETRLGKGELDLPVPLYTPARIHVITDRPLYEPGNQVHFRAVGARVRSDLAPIDGSSRLVGRQGSEWHGAPRGEGGRR